MLDDPEIKAKRLNGQLWYEIDDVQDLDIATSMFAPNNDQKVLLLQNRYGGYWRYPQLIDFCYLVNPYFPPQKLVDEIKASFEKLLTQYPSGMSVNSLLAAKNFEVHAENVVVGNGAAELIKALLEKFQGKTGFIRPTFEEYPNRYDGEDSIFFVPQNYSYTYSAKDVIEFFDDKKIDNLIIVNPDNPTGNYIDKNGLLKLVEWSKKKNIKLVIDESFVDFSDQNDSTLIELDILLQNPHLFVMKSISKSYGVPGLRLGILVSGDVEAIREIKNNVSIWNINSFAEFYLQIAEKYKKDYVLALKLFKEERSRFITELQKINFLRVIPTQANYVMVELSDKITAKEFTKKLLIKHNIFVKDLTKKIGEKYVRIAIRNKEDNDKLITALKKEFEI